MKHLITRSFLPHRGAALSTRRKLWMILCLISILSLLLVAADGRPVDPLGSQLYSLNFDAKVSAGANYTINVKLDQSQMVSIALVPVDPFRAVLSLKKGADTLRTAAATTVGQALLIQSVLVPPGDAQTYSVEISAPDSAPAGTTYDFQINIYSSAVEEEDFSGVTNDILADAEVLNNSFVQITTGVQRGGVYGRLSSDTDVDYYAFQLNEGEHIEAVMTDWGSQVTGFDLLNSIGDPLSITPVTGINFNKMLVFDVAFTGTYYARISGASAPANYSLLLLRGAAFSIEPNHTFETAQVISGVRAVFGSVYVPPVDGTTIPFLNVDETPMKVGFRSSGAFYYDQYNGNSNIGLRLYDTEYLGSGGGQFSSFTYCYGLGAARTCPFHHYLSATYINPSNHKQTLAGEHYMIFDGDNDLLHFMRVLRWHPGDTKLIITTQLTNLGTAPLEGLQALESIDPNPGGTAATLNDVLDSKVIQASNANGALVIGSNDARVSAGVMAGDIANPQLIFDTPIDPNGASSASALHLAFDLSDPIPSGGRVSYTYVLALGTTVEEALTSYQAGYPWNAELSLDNLYAFDMLAGQKLVLRTLLPYKNNAETFINKLDPVLKLYGPDHTLLAENDDCSDNAANHCTLLAPEAQIEYEAAQDGRYYVQVTNSSKTSLVSQWMTAQAGSDFVLLVTQDNKPDIQSFIRNQVEIPVSPATPPEFDLTIGDSLVLQVKAVDADTSSGDTLTFSLAAGAPEGSSIDNVSGVFTWTPTQVGSYPLTVVVEDRSWSQDSQPFTIVVKEVVRYLNSLPMIINR